MKQLLRKLLLISLVMRFGILNAQVNLIPNPSFEDTLPFKYVNIGYALNYWNSLDSNRKQIASGFLFSTSSSFTGTGSHLPNTFWFNQYPKTGNNVISLTTYWNTNLTPPPPTVRGVTRVLLKSALQVNKRYCAKINVSAFSAETYFTNGLGIYCDNGQLDTIVAKDSSGQYPFVHPQVQCPFVIDDTLNWQSFSGTFMANGTETFCTLGNFLSDSQTNKIYNMANRSGFGADTLGCRCSEILIDDVSLIPVDIANWLHDTSCAIGDSVHIGLPKYEVPDALWYNMNGVQIAKGSGLWVHPTQAVTQYIQAIDVCDRVAFDTMTVYAYPLSIENEKLLIDNKVQIYPNPSSGIFNVTVSNKLIGQQIILQDITGKEIMQLTANPQNEISLQGYASGIYFVMVGGITKKIFKQ
jgi:Secretion system C-terminal sorting domain